MAQIVDTTRSTVENFNKILDGLAMVVARAPEWSLCGRARRGADCMEDFAQDRPARNASVALAESYGARSMAPSSPPRPLQSPSCAQQTGSKSTKKPRTGRDRATQPAGGRRSRRARRHPQQIMGAGPKLEALCTALAYFPLTRLQGGKRPKLRGWTALEGFRPSW